ncbi:MAG: hypothetical protein K0Q55_3916, partial [Verrucomicrobia bacterium]|nr:hypothetical protein [Verrucomicrobiota bacterium]
MRYLCQNPDCDQKPLRLPGPGEEPPQCPTCGTALHPDRRLTVIDRIIHAAAEGLKEERLGWTVLLTVACITLSVAVWNWFFWPQDYERILREVTAVGEFRKSPVASPNGEQLLYARNGDSGVGIYLSRRGSASSRQLESIDVPDDRFNLFGWSPDSHFLLYSTLLPSSKRHQLTIADGETGKYITSVVLDGSPTELCWMGDRMFAAVDSELNLYSGTLTENGQVPQLTKLKKLAGDNDAAISLMRFDGESIAYNHAGKIWKLNIFNQQAEALTSFGAKSFKWLNYNEAQKEFLFCESAEGRDYVYKYSPISRELTQLSKEHSLNSQWLGIGRGYAYVGNPDSRSYLSVRPPGEKGSTNLFAEGHVRSYSVSPSGTRLYAVAAQGHEPLGIWEYDLESRQLVNAVPALTRPFTYAKVIPPASSTAPVRGTTPVTYFMLAPKDYDRNKKYPVVIDGPQSSRWQAHSQFLANVGIFYVAVNRRGLSSSDDMSGAVDDMLAVYAKLIKNPNIDP